MNKKYLLFLYSFFIFLIDQVVKYLINLYKPSIIVIKNVFFVTYEKNTGVAFSMLSDNKILIIIISIILLSIFLYIIYKDIIINKDNNKLKYISYILLLGGILGNLFDRIIRGYVIDFISIKIFGYYFPVFNIADICITVSVIMLIIYMLFIENREKNKKNMI